MTKKRKRWGGKKWLDPKTGELTREALERQDLIDNAIDRLLSEVLGYYRVAYEHDMEISGEIRDRILPVLARLTDESEDDLYPGYELEE